MGPISVGSGRWSAAAVMKVTNRAAGAGKLVCH